MTSQKVAVVTGSNKGIGFAIVKGLCEKYNGIVYLTARDVNRGELAVSKMKEQGLNPLFHQLDITDQESITKFKDHLVTTYGGLDLLVNNAAIAFNEDGKESLSEQAKLTVDVNYFATLRVCETLFPILRKDARVVNVSSSAGHLSRIPAAELRAKFSDPSLTVPKLNELMQQFVKERENDQHGEAGWPDSAYIVSKVGLSALTILQQKQFDNEAPNRNVQVNSVHPGYVDTDMTSHKGHLTIEEGAKAPLYLALEPHNLKGKYVWFNSQVLDWYADSTPSRA